MLTFGKASIVCLGLGKRRTTKEPRPVWPEIFHAENLEDAKKERLGVRGPPETTAGAGAGVG